MKAVILAAGEGRRLNPFTTSKPKVMIKVANMPILEYVIRALSENSIREIIIVVGYRKESISSYFGDGKKFGTEITYAVQEKLIGTANALLQAKQYIDSDFLVLAGDNIIDARTISELVKSKNPTLLITESEIPSKYGVVLTGDGKITRIVEKPEEEISNLISTGIYLFSPDIFDEIEELSKVGKHDLTSVVQHIIETGLEVNWVKSSGTWIDAVYPWDLLTVNATALNNIELRTSGTIEGNVTIKGCVSIGEKSIIRANSYIVGPVVIGKGCEIGPNTCIFPSTSIGDNVVIGSFTEIKNSMMMDDVSIGSNSIVSHSIIGEGTSLGSHFISDGDKALIRTENGFQELRNIGAIIGEDCIIGNNVVIMPGIIIGADCKISSLKRLSENIPANSRVV